MPENLYQKHALGGGWQNPLLTLRVSGGRGTAGRSTRREAEADGDDEVADVLLLDLATVASAR